MTSKAIRLNIGSIFPKGPGKIYFYRYQVDGHRKTVKIWKIFWKRHKPPFSKNRNFLEKGPLTVPSFSVYIKGRLFQNSSKLSKRPRFDLIKGAFSAVTLLVATSNYPFQLFANGIFAIFWMTFEITSRDKLYIFIRGIFREYEFYYIGVAVSDRGSDHPAFKGECVSISKPLKYRRTEWFHIFMISTHPELSRKR